MREIAPGKCLRGINITINKFFGLKGPTEKAEGAGQMCQFMSDQVHDFFSPGQWHPGALCVCKGKTEPASFLCALELLAQRKTLLISSRRMASWQSDSSLTAHEDQDK